MTTDQDENEPLVGGSSNTVLDQKNYQSTAASASASGSSKPRQRRGSKVLTSGPLDYTNTNNANNDSSPQRQRRGSAVFAQTSASGGVSSAIIGVPEQREIMNDNQHEINSINIAMNASSTALKYSDPRQVQIQSQNPNRAPPPRSDAKMDRVFFMAALATEVSLLILFAVATDYQDARPTQAVDTARHNYYLFQQVNVMMFIGFGYLMTFLRRYGYSAITYNFMIAAICMQWGMFMTGLSDVLFTYVPHTLTVSVDGLARGDFAAATVLISFGAILGRTSPLQLLVMALIEVVMYSINLYIETEMLLVADVGCSITVHVFGCYFGLAVSYMLGKPQNELHNVADATSDLFSMIGTIFLWMYWPSFNGIFAGVLPFAQTRCFMNTILSLCSCVVVSLAFSKFLSAGYKFDMAHVQNATLAGGVAMGSAATLYLTPAGAIAGGLVAAIVSVCGFAYLSPVLETRLRIWDTCGIHNLHGMPGVLGGLISSVAIGAATTAHYSAGAFHGRSFSFQAGIQVIGIMVSFSIAVVSGLATGFLLRRIGSPARYPYNDKEHFKLQALQLTFDNEYERVMSASARLLKV